MENYLFLTWFYSTKHFNHLIFELLSSKKPSFELESLYQKHEAEIIRLKGILKNKKIEVLLYTNSDYPIFFKNLERPPWVICTYGNLDILKSKVKLAVVGSRRPDPEAKYWLHQEIARLDKSVVLISGGAVGIDQAVHKASHLNKLSGVCVLPVGILEIYPQSLKPLVNSCMESGDFLVLSQFHPEKKVCKSSFYPRNHIIAAMSESVLIVQAAEKSGTMVTAKYAVDLGKSVYVLPASPWDSRYAGNVKLLDEGAYQIIDLNLIHL